ncbi:MAG TPA: divalent-cation tolerance protein CutA [Gammaproteobacteria bacterium]
MSAQTMVVLTTCGSSDDAASLAQLLVERRLAACVNVIADVASTYRWQGRVQQDRETLLIVKTMSTRLTEVTAAIVAESKYELPEVIALPVEAGFAPYLKWLGESVGELKD